jgi:hypothetical protein
MPAVPPLARDQWTYTACMVAIAGVLNVSLPELSVLAETLDFFPPV